MPTLQEYLTSTGTSVDDFAERLKVSPDSVLSFMYPWLSPEMIRTLRDQGVDLEAYAKQASRLRSDTEEGLTPRVLTPEEEAQIADEIDEPLRPFPDE